MISVVHQGADTIDTEIRLKGPLRCSFESGFGTNVGHGPLLINNNAYKVKLCGENSFIESASQQ